MPLVSVRITTVPAAISIVRRSGKTWSIGGGIRSQIGTPAPPGAMYQLNTSSRAARPASLSRAAAPAATTVRKLSSVGTHLPASPRASTTGGGAALNPAKLVSGIRSPSLVVISRPNALPRSSPVRGRAHHDARARADRFASEPEAAGLCYGHHLDLLQEPSAVGALRLQRHDDVGVRPRERGDGPFDGHLPRHIVGRPAVMGGRGARRGQAHGEGDRDTDSANPQPNPCRARRQINDFRSGLVFLEHCPAQGIGGAPPA